jgi:hypothetical protein
MPKNEAKQWDDSICWFCRKRPADEDAAHEVELFQVLEREEKYIVVETDVRQRYTTSKASVPRCRRCRLFHDTVGTFSGFIWLALAFAGVGFHLLALPIALREYPLVDVFGLTVVLFPVFLATAFMTVTGLWYLSRLWQWRDKAANHPSVKALTEQGWHIGRTPPFK